MPQSADHDWLALVDMSGLVVSEPVLGAHFPDGPIAVPEYLQRKLTTEWERFSLNERDRQSRWVNFVLEDLFDLPADNWRKANAVPEQATYPLVEYAQTLRPSRVLLNGQGEPILLVNIVRPAQGLDAPEREPGKWYASPARKLNRLMRAVEVPLGLLTNGRQFRLLYGEAGTTTSYITWSAQTWAEDAGMLEAACTLLGRERFFGDDDEKLLLSLIKESQERQLDVTDQLGDQVAEALEQFVRALGRADARANGEILGAMSLDDVYEMALVFMMRLVFLLYGEENMLLPHGEVLYDQSYGVTHLWTELSAQRQDDAAAMRNRFDAYPRLLATFRLIHGGCDHEDLSLLGYGGKLFDPERFPALEHPKLRISNETIADILQGLLFARAKLGRKYVSQRVSYRALDVEQLGSVYEGLIDGMVQRADEVMVTIDSGDEPVVPLAEIEVRSPLTPIGSSAEGPNGDAAHSERQWSGPDGSPPDLRSGIPWAPPKDTDSGSAEELADYLRSVSSMSRKRAERVADEVAEYDADEGQGKGNGETADGPDGSPPEGEGERQSAHSERQRSGPDGSPPRLTARYPMGPSERQEAADRDAETVARIAPYAEFLKVSATVLPGDLYIVHRSGQRKAGGQYYTPKWITTFIVERTLEPLVYEDVSRSEGPNGDTADSERQRSGPDGSPPDLRSGIPWAPPNGTADGDDAGGADGRPQGEADTTKADGERQRSGPDGSPPDLRSGCLRHSSKSMAPPNAAGNGDGEDGGGRKRIKSPDEILDLKVCDPAMGSGAFLVQACRYLSERLVDSWERIESERGIPGRLTLPYCEPATGEPGEIPLPDDREEAEIWARRFVADNCLYGVDVNHLAVELAKMSLWLATLSEGRPFTFLDHKLKHGNSIIGAWADDIDDYPVDAWDRKVDDDDVHENLKDVRKQVRGQLRQLEEDRQQGKVPLFSAKVPEVRAEAARIMRSIEGIDTQDPGEKERLYQQRLQENEEWQAIKRMYDAWCALWFWPVQEFEDGDVEPVPPEELPLVWGYRELQQSLQPNSDEPDYITATPGQLENWHDTLGCLQDDIHFFHWELEFPDVFECGGFDGVVMNPPWDHYEFDDRDFFALRRRDIVAAPNSAKRNEMIAELSESNASLYLERQQAQATVHDTQSFIRGSGHFPLTAVGRLNKYQLFAGLARHLIDAAGHAGFVIPSGIATDYYTHGFFNDLMHTRTLRALYDFENRDGIFRDVDSRMKFSLVFIGQRTDAADFAFFITDPDALEDEWRHFELTDQDIELLNPNTKTCPIFRSKRDAELTKAIYRHEPVLVRETCEDESKRLEEANPWGIDLHLMFMMNTDSHLFRTREDLERQGFELDRCCSRFVKGDRVYLPVYEAKMIHQFDHRFASVVGQVSTGGSVGSTEYTTSVGHRSPTVTALPRYWVPSDAVADRWPHASRGQEWVPCYRRVARSTDMRTMMACMLPRVAPNAQLPVISLGDDAHLVAAFIAAQNSFVLDYCARQKVGGTHIDFFTAKQLPFPPPSRYREHFCDEPVIAIISTCVLELTYTAWDIKAFAEDMGYHGPPFLWDEERRAQLRAQLDAIYFHLYEIDRDDVDHIMETFPIVKRKDVEQYGEYRTKNLILSYYDAYAHGDMDAWFGPPEKREPQAHPDDAPEGLDALGDQ